MLIVETVARIRREFFVKGKSIKEIVRDLGVSRNTVRKVLRSGETAFTYERSVQPLPKLGPWASDLNRLLEANDRKTRRERLTMVRLFEELQGLGYRGGYAFLGRGVEGGSEQHPDASDQTKSTLYVNRRYIIPGLLQRISTVSSAN